MFLVFFYNTILLILQYGIVGVVVADREGVKIYKGWLHHVM